MLTRRQFVIGAGALFAAAAGGVEVVGPARVLRRVGLRSDPDVHVPSGGWQVDHGMMQSAVMRRAVPWQIAGPPSGAASGVIVCPHGRGDDERYAFDTMRMHDVAAAVAPTWAVASTTGGPSTYWHKRRDGTDAGALVTDEFVPFVQRRLGVQRVALLGWSIGGYGALLAAARYPGRFAAVAAGSPALWQRASETAPGAFDGAEDYAANDVFALADALRRNRVRIDCGLSDPFLSADRALATRVGASASFTPGHHGAAFWRTVAPDQLKFF